MLDRRQKSIRRVAKCLFLLWGLLPGTLPVVSQSRHSAPDDFSGNIVLASGGSVQLVEPGEFHGDEVHPALLSGWMGLTPSVDGFVWRSFVLHSEQVHDEVVDEETPAKTGRKIWVDGAQPIFLTRGLNISPATQVITIFHQANGEDISGARELRVGTHRYTLRVLGPNPNSDHVGLGAGASLVLESEGIRQTLAHFVKGGDRFELLWAGDLDGDGYLDLYMDISGNYNVSNRVLFTSKNAPKSKLVVASAMRMTTGC